MTPKALRISSRTLLLALALTLACAGAAHADTFGAGEFITYVQGAWSCCVPTLGGSDPSTLLVTNFFSVYAPSGIVTVGLPSGGFTMRFDDPFFILVYLPAGGPPAVLTSNVDDPSITSAGGFGGDVLALELNIDFSNAGFLAHPTGTPFGDLILENFTTLPALNGLTVNQFLADANTCLGGGSCLLDLNTMDAIANDLNAAFEGGTPDSFAQGTATLPSHLALPTSATVPEPSSLVLLAFGLLGLVGFANRRRTDANSILA